MVFSYDIEFMEKEITEAMDWYNLPSHMKPGLVSYVLYGILPGSFLMNVLTNSFAGAIGTADNENRKHIADWASFLISYMPYGAWGDKKTVYRWAERKGCMGTALSGDD